MKRYILFAFLGLSAIAFKVKGQAKDLNLNNLYFSALQGDVHSIIAKLDSLPDTLLNKEQLEFKHKYLSRFVLNNENYDYRTKDTALISIIRIYKDYWQKILMKKQPLEEADKELTKEITGYIWESYYKTTGINKDTILNNFTDYTKKLLEQKKFGVANGKTSNYFDLLVWAKQSEVHYKAKLPESKTTVKVIFMEDVVTMGWEEYATFGTYFPGGWAKPDALYCMESSYDLKSENFKISYIKHEGQHFADYKLYPDLSGADLEYRAKLVELANAQKSVYELISFFISNSSRDRSNSHAFANNCMIRDLSRLLFKQDWMADMEKWKKISYKEINKNSLLLLRQNSLNLQNKGKAVKEFIE